jgi:transposase
MLAYTTAKGKSGYGGIDTTYTFEHNGGYYTCRAVVVKSDELCKQQGKTLDRNLGKVDADLQKIKGQLNVRKYKNVDYVIDQVKKKLDKHGCYGKLFHVVLGGEEDALTLTWDYGTEALEKERRLLGKYVLVTGLEKETHDANQVLEAYKSRHRVEDQIRTTKSTLKIRPVFLQSDKRIRALVLVNVIALIVYALVEHVCKQEGLAKSAKQAFFMFRMPAIVAVTVNGQSIRAIGNIKPFMRQLLDDLKVKPLEMNNMDTG